MEACIESESESYFNNVGNDGSTINGITNTRTIENNQNNNNDELMNIVVVEEPRNTINTSTLSINTDRNDSLGAQREQNLPPDLFSTSRYSIINNYRRGPSFRDFSNPIFRLTRNENSRILSGSQNNSNLLSRRRQLDFLPSRGFGNSINQLTSTTTPSNLNVNTNNRTGIYDGMIGHSLFRPILSYPDYTNSTRYDDIANTYSNNTRRIFDTPNISEILLNFNETRNSRSTNNSIYNNRNTTTTVNRNDVISVNESSSDSSSSYSISLSLSESSNDSRQNVSTNNNTIYLNQYTNFRDYPLNMSFADTRSNDDFIKTIYCSYGHFAVALYNIALKYKLNIPTLFVTNSEDWMKLFFKYMSNLIRKTYSTTKKAKDIIATNSNSNNNIKESRDIKDREELMSKYFINNKPLLDVFKDLPSINKIRSIIWKKQYSVKESLIIKLTLDLWESFFYYSSSSSSLSDSKFDCGINENQSSKYSRCSEINENCYKQNYKDFIDTAIEIYGLFSDEDLREIYVNLYKFNFKSSVCFQTREENICYYKGVKRRFVELNEGLKSSMFVV